MQIAFTNCKLPIFYCKFHTSFSQQPNLNRELAVRFTQVELDQMHFFVDCHGDPTTMSLYLILNVAHILCHCQLPIANCKLQIFNFKSQIVNCQYLIQRIWMVLAQGVLRPFSHHPERDQYAYCKLKVPMYQYKDW